MVQILPREENFLSNLGTGLSAGISSGLNELAQHKLNDIVRQREKLQIQKGLEPIFGVEKATYLSNLPTPLLGHVLKQELQAPGNEAYLNAIAQSAGIQLPDTGLSTTPQTGIGALRYLSPQAQSDMQQLQQAELGNNQEDLLNNLLSRQQGFSPSEMDQALAMGQPTAEKQIAPTKKGNQIDRMQAETVSAGRQLPAGFNLMNPMQKAKWLTFDAKQRELERNAAFNREKFDYKKEQDVKKQESANLKYLKPDLDLLKEKARTSENNIKIYNQLIKNTESGKIRSGNTQQLMTKLGLQDFWANPETQLSKKLIARLAQNAASAFNTSKLTNLDVNLYKDSLPSLVNTDAGLITIAKNNILEEQANVIRNKAANELIRQGRIDPKEFDTLLEDAIAPQLAELADQALQNIQQAVNQAQPQNAKLSAGQTIEKLPPAAQYPGAQIQDEETGNIYVSNGKNWARKG